MNVKSTSPGLYGLLMLSGFILYFFIMKAVGLYTEPGFRIFNVMIHGSMIYLAMKAARRNKKDHLKWGATVMTGIKASAIGVVGFALFQYLYLEFLDPEFLSFVKQNAILGELLTPFRASFFLLAEGLGVSVFFSYMGMRHIEYSEARKESAGNLSMRVQEEWRG